MNLAPYRKGLVALAGFVVQVIPALTLHGSAEKVAAVVLAFATWVTVHLVPNAPAVPEVTP